MFVDKTVSQVQTHRIYRWIHPFLITPRLAATSSVGIFPDVNNAIIIALDSFAPYNLLECSTTLWYYYYKRLVMKPSMLEQTCKRECLMNLKHWGVPSTTSVLGSFTSITNHSTCGIRLMWTRNTRVNPILFQDKGTCATGTWNLQICEPETPALTPTLHDGALQISSAFKTRPTPLRKTTSFWIRLCLFGSALHTRVHDNASYQHLWVRCENILSLAKSPFSSIKIRDKGFLFYMRIW